MMEYNKIKKRRENLDTLRAIEILYTVINEIENNHFEDGDFQDDKEYILDRLYEIKVNQFPRFNRVDELEERLYEIIGENFVLFIPPESKIYKTYRKVDTI